MLKLIGITKDYKTVGQTVHALKGVDLAFRRNEFVSVLGASGCGKTTLLNIIGGLDKYTSGDLVINGKSTKEYKDRDWDAYRNHRVGFVFQSYNLIPHQTILGNVEIALTIAGVSKAERRRRAEEALKRVGLEKEIKKRPNQLSGGQMQRVAIARALVNNPEILLADEPTGALDTETSVQIMDLIREIAGERLVIMVTHNPEIAEEYSTRIVRLQDGLVISDSNPYDGETEQATEQAEEVAGVMDVVDKSARGVVDEALKKGAPITEDALSKGVQDSVKAVSGEPLTKKEQKQAKKRAKKEAKAKKKEEKKNRERASMSFKTSLGLSARNLAMKKGRTMITSFAGSIGIISVCLVLALSNGFNNYILKTEEDMLSRYPIEITETAMDMEAIMSGMNSLENMPDMDKLGDKVYVNSFLTNIAQGMQVTNDISQDYINYLEGMDESLYTAISYDVGMDLTPNLFTEVELLNESGEKTKKAISLHTLKKYYAQKLSAQEEKYARLVPLVDILGAIYGKMPGTRDVADDEFGQYVLSQYDLVGEGSRFPTASNEAVIVIGANNDVTDLTLAQLGLMSEETFMSLFPETATGEVDETEIKTMDFSTILGKKYVFNYNDAIYTPSQAGTYMFDYEGTRDALGSDAEKGAEITITGILRLKDGLTYGCLQSGLNLTEQFYNEMQAKNASSKIVEDIKNQAQNQAGLVAQLTVLQERLTSAETELEKMMIQKEMQELFAENGKYFLPASSTLQDYYQTSASTATTVYILYGDTVLRAVGGKANPSSVKLYTDTFDAKEGLLAHLDAWNDTHDKETEVRYTDTVGLMMSMVQTILNAITYVLVAFTAISLVVSSVMIGIITYVSVVERVKEIGVLRSLGARKRDIKNLFNAETFIIGLSSGVFGVAVTYLLSLVVNLIMDSLTGIATLASLPVLSALIMVVISISLTLISGLIPARSAAKKDPVVALRTE